MIRPLRHMGHEGPRHRVAPPSPQERRLRRFQDAAARQHANDPGPRVFVQTPDGIRRVSLIRLLGVTRDPKDGAS